MSLSCECGDYDDADWYYMDTSDYKPLNTKRRRKCCSCNSLIDIGALCVECPRFRKPGYDTIEEKIFGEDGQIWLGSHAAGENPASPSKAALKGDRDDRNC